MKEEVNQECEAMAAIEHYKETRECKSLQAIEREGMKNCTNKTL